ncbi:hypothetical protein [Apilactobacillus xinyiensis]|uniref:hypothetical protein n=1 Tax=Apilactobacillus xinyiensis TaxID=2841032 RepID=UPI001C7CF824|nr:hypothetical protein [Apilactobacillus xinyiensis]MCL0312215.1 hypothetical protein [Apilactobacillus xinyiensis]MCL0329741.1 hypothetical protein [Apilactobacillus xinyiensis]
MNEDILFNPGNAIASDVNPNDIIRTAQITADKRQQKDTLVMVKDKENNEHLLFEVSDQVGDSEKAHAYKIERKF